MSLKKSLLTSGREKKFYPELEAYIRENYIAPEDTVPRDLCEPMRLSANKEMAAPLSLGKRKSSSAAPLMSAAPIMKGETGGATPPITIGIKPQVFEKFAPRRPSSKELKAANFELADSMEDVEFDDEHESKLTERLRHLSDTFSEYLFYLIEDKGMDNVEVYKRAIVDKKVFSKIKNDPNYHPQKMTAMCLCVGAKLNLDETKDLLARAGYALSPCEMTDVIFAYFIENEIYDMIELDIQLEEHGQKCLIS